MMQWEECCEGGELIKLLAALAAAKDITDVNIAAGIALEEAQKGPGKGQTESEATKAN